MAITSIDQIVAGLATSTRRVPMLKSTQVSAVTSYVSMWLGGGAPAAGVAPTTAATPTNATAGALNIGLANAAVGKDLFIARSSITGANNTTPFLFCDRVGHMGGLSGIVTTAQTVGVSVNALRGGRVISDLRNVRWWIEIYTAIGATAVTATVTYTRDSDGTSQTTTVSIGSTTGNQLSRMLPIFPAGTDVIRSIDSITHVTTGTAGNYGVTATVDLFESPNNLAGGNVLLEWTGTGLAEVKDDCCLMGIVIASLATTGNCTGNITIIEV